MPPPQISFVIPVLDEAAVIRRTLDEILKSRGEAQLDLEVVVADGGSVDATVSEAAGADRLVTGSAQAARNIAGGRNAGAAASAAPLLFHTDADVLFQDLPRLIADVCSAFADERVVALTTSLWPYPWDTNRTDQYMHHFGNVLIRICTRLGAGVVRGECLVIRRNIFEQVGGFDERIALGEDCDLFRRVGRLGRVIFLPQHRVYHSTRRFRQWGYGRTLLAFGREAVWQLLLHRPYLSRWEPVR